MQKKKDKICVSENIRCSQTQGLVQDFLKGGSNLQRGFDLLILHDYQLFFKDFSENSP